MTDSAESKARILAVEDSPTQGELLLEDLRAAGFDVTLAATGEDALECFGAQSFHLVLSDIVMPGIDGYEVCRQVKEMDRDVAVVMLTSLTDPLEIVRGLEAGADNFLRKPYDPAQLVSRLQTMLYHREMRASGRANMGLEVMLRDKRFLITAERQQILDLLMSSFEDLVAANHELRNREEALTVAHAELREQFAATERERRRIATMLRAAPNAMVIVDADGVVTDASDHLCTLLGRDRTAIVGRRVAEVAAYVDANGQPVATARPIRKVLHTGCDIAESGNDFDLFVETGDGERLPVIARAAAVRDSQGQLVAVVGAMHEIGSLAAHDPVTKLPNQSVFADRIARALAVGRDDGCTAVLAFVVEPLATLRQGLSGSSGDGLVAAIADRVRTAVEEEELVPDREATTAAYFGGDVFAVLVPGLVDDVHGVRLAGALRERLAARPFHVEGMQVDLRFSVGVAIAHVGDRPDLAAAAAVAAARRASQSGGGGVETTDPLLDARSGEWLRRVHELRTALDRNELVVHYQPTMDLRRRTAVGVEALVRWQRPDGTLVPPGDFLPLAEESGLIVSLGWWVLREACRQIAQWRSSLAGGEQMTISVNIDAQQLADPAITEQVRRALDDAELPADALTLEITESGMLRDVERAVARLEDLKRLGVRLAVDDFGTAYSSLVQLRRFPVDILKIDRSFVSGMTRNPADAAIVAATVRLGRSLGLETVAEGVESAEELVQLRILGCDAAQGFHWSKPLAADALVARWTEHRGAPVADDETTTDVVDDSDARVEEVLAYVVHELATPLTAVLGYAHVARDATAEDVPRYVDIIIRNAQAIERGIALLTDAQSSFEGTLRLETSHVEVTSLVRTLVDDLRPQLGAHHVTVEAPERVVAELDPARLTQAVSNLLVNAAKFSAADALIEVTVQSVDDNLEIAVRDRGEGVPPERRGELFRRFARLGSRRKGMGLGLYLVRTIARAHGGDVRYEPAEPGSRFVLSLPLLKQPVSAAPGARVAS